MNIMDMMMSMIGQIGGGKETKCDGEFCYGIVFHNSQESGQNYWATRSSICMLARTAHSFACSTLLASLARSAALICSIACSLSHSQSNQAVHPLARERNSYIVQTVAQNWSVGNIEPIQSIRRMRILSPTTPTTPNTYL